MDVRGGGIGHISICKAVSLMLDETTEALLVAASGGRMVHGPTRIIGAKHTVVVVV